MSGLLNLFGRGAADGKAVLWKDTFSGAAALLSNHTPDIGTSYPATPTFNGNFSYVDAGAMSGCQVDGNGCLAGTATTGRGGMFNIGKTACIVSLKVNALAGQNLYYGVRALPTSNTYCPTIKVGPTQIVLTKPNDIADVTWNGTVAAGDVITIEDNGGTTAGWLIIKLNGVQIISAATGNANNTRTYHGISCRLSSGNKWDEFTVTDY